MKKISLVLFSVIAFLFSFYAVADEGYGYKILAEHHWVKNTKDLGYIDLPVKKIIDPKDSSCHCIKKRCKCSRGPIRRN